MKKIIIIILALSFGLTSLSLEYFLIGIPIPSKHVEYGVNFSAKNMRDYGLDPKIALQNILDDFKVKNIRLMAYWEDLEVKPNQYDFSDLDWQIQKVEQKNGKIILALGQKVPRWPECHIPEWALSLTQTEREQKLLTFIQNLVNHYKSNPAIIAWQVENEPFFFQSFGSCPAEISKSLDKEIALVKSLDSHPIILTSSGELSLWAGEYRRADIFATSLYKYTHNRFVGYQKYRIPAIFYQRKIALLKLLYGKKPIIVSEQQAEPWVHGYALKDAPIDITNKTMTPQKFQEIVNYSKKCGFDTAYFWGVEWWYYLKTKGDNTYWQMAKKYF